MKPSQFKKIKAAVDFAAKNKYSDFYRKKYLQKIRLNSPKDFFKIPFLTRKEIANTHPLSRLFVPHSEIAGWCQTSGTTSKKSLLIPISKLKQDYLDLLAEKLKKLAVTKILLLKPSGYTNERLIDWNSHSKLSKYPQILGDMRNLELTAQVASELAVDGLETTPSALNFLIPYLKETYDLNNIKFVRLGGEYTSDQKYRFFKSYFKKAYFDFTFGGMESRGNKGLRCDQLSANLSPRFFHPRSDFFYFEVIEGELVLTTLFRTPFPVIRYKTGDLVSIQNYSCPCKRKGLMEVLGRTGQVSIRVGGVTIYRHLVEEALPKFNGDWELHIFEEIKNNRLLPKLVLHLSGVQKSNIVSLQQRIENNLKVGPDLYLKKLIDEDIFLPLEIKLVDKFDTNYKQLKLVSHIK